jgi:hypothetical protein
MPVQQNSDEERSTQQQKASRSLIMISFPHQTIATIMLIYGVWVVKEILRGSAEDHR